MTHHIAVTIEDGSVEGKITCSAEVGAKCRLTCPVGCESWDWEGHDHEFVDGGECMMLPFVDSSWDLWELYEGVPGPLRSGAVDLTYANEQVTWEYTPDRERGHCYPRENHAEFRLRTDTCFDCGHVATPTTEPKEQGNE